MATSSKYPPILNKDLRDLVQRRGEPIPQSVALQERDRTVRMTLMAAARDNLDEVPDEVTCWYVPDQHAVVTMLPEPESDDTDTTLSDFGV